MRVGLPRALLYFKYYPVLEQLFRSNGWEPVISTPTNKRKLEQGLALCEDEVCLPVKVMMGHVRSLAEQDIDALFVPRVVSLERKRYICPKFLGLPDMVRCSLGNEIPLISPTVNLSWSRLKIWQEGLKSCNCLKPWRWWLSLNSAARIHRRHLQAGEPVSPGGGKRVAVLGHCYNIYDEYVNFGLLNTLAQLGVTVLTVENFTREQIEEGARGLSKDLFWSYGRDVVGAAFYCLARGAADGVILVASFGCGPDSLIIEIIQQRFARFDIPLMCLTLDEHAADTGLVTRVEAFVDMLNWRDVC